MPDAYESAFSFRPAVRENTPIVMALAGASGSGKTYTALELAMGMAEPEGKIAAIDSEGRRALHYADLRDEKGAVRFRFDHCELRPPFEPARYLAAMKAAEAAGYRVIVVDSQSDEHEGEGGLIDMAARGKSENTAANWARPKAEHKLIIRWLRQTRCHVIFCLRAEERVRFERVFDEKKGREVTVVVPLGWMPVCEKRFMFDMTASFLLTPDKPGIPQPIKLQEQHRAFFPKDTPIGRECGAALAAWATGGVAPQGGGPPARDIEAEGYEAAAKGKAALQAFWSALSRVERAPFAGLIGTRDDPGEWTLTAVAADAAPPDEIPFSSETAAADGPLPASEAEVCGGSGVSPPAAPIEIPMNGLIPNYEAWAALFVPRLREQQTSSDLAWFIGANESQIEAARAGLGKLYTELVGDAIKEQWGKI